MEDVDPTDGHRSLIGVGEGERLRRMTGIEDGVVLQYGEMAIAHVGDDSHDDIRSIGAMRQCADEAGLDRR